MSLFVKIILVCLIPQVISAFPPFVANKSSKRIKTGSPNEFSSLDLFIMLVSLWWCMSIRATFTVPAGVVSRGLRMDTPLGLAHVKEEAYIKLQLGKQSQIRFVPDYHTHVSNIIPSYPVQMGYACRCLWNRAANEQSANRDIHVHIYGQLKVYCMGLCRPVVVVITMLCLGAAQVYAKWL